MSVFQFKRNFLKKLLTLKYIINSISLGIKTRNIFVLLSLQYTHKTL